MKISDIAALPVQAGAALRHARLFHPSGVLATGTIERVAPPNEGLPVPSGDVVGRVSKAVGLPDSWPDIVGLAWRMTDPESGRPWDVLLASTFGEGIGRLLLRPVASWSDVSFTSLMPLRYGDGLWWVRARMTTVLDVAGLPLSAAEDRIAGDGELEFDIEQAAGTGEFHPLATLTLRARAPKGEDVSFDPTHNSAPGVRLFPGWLTDFREAAYRRSREGRDAE
ncbi:phosphodiesterase [Mycobacterium sp. CPCC 205372]|uniref:Phosphodiesterase n=1 Tax=Mycobacterium hippophais TaxID=3016340 RepID=A0ABT4PP56_9MYCO|nr:phosphodiesterase [Mycobacterium hippophais]MCZ8378331.1 phosphodiesterase [Mycobacterium hippophais]